MYVITIKFTKCSLLVTLLADEIGLFRLNSHLYQNNFFGSYLLKTLKILPFAYPHYDYFLVFLTEREMMSHGAVANSSAIGYAINLLFTILIVIVSIIVFTIIIMLLLCY